MGLFDKGGFLSNFMNAALTGATGGIMGQPKAPGTTTPSSTISDILASIAYIGGQTPQGQEIIAQTSGSYAGATFKNNWLWIAIIAIMGVFLIVLSRRK